MRYRRASIAGATYFFTVNLTDRKSHLLVEQINPVKHGYVRRAVDWPYSSIHREIARGNLNRDWGCSNEDDGGNWGE